MKSVLFTQTDNVDLMVKGGIPMGGAVVETFVWMRALNELGYKVLQSREIGDERVLKEGFDWINFIPSYDPNIGIKWLRWVFYRFPTYFKHFKSAHPDFVYESIPTWASMFTALMCKMIGTKFILRIANDNMLDERILITHSRFKRYMIYRSFALADVILPQNRYQLGRLKEMYPHKKVHLLYNPFVIDKDYLKEKATKSGYIAWVANFRYQKNLKLLYEIAREFKEQSFRVAGAPLPSMDEETASFLSKLQKMPNVEFVGTIQRDEILDFFSNASYLLNTSHYEGFSNTFLEAMATGTPILTSVAVNPDGIIDRFDLGIVYDSVPDLRFKFQGIDEAQYRSLSKNCVEYVQHYHGHLEIGKQLIAVLDA